MKKLENRWIKELFAVFNILVAVFLITFLAVVDCYASPFLACDPHPPIEDPVTQAQVEMDGNWENTFDVPGCTQKQVGCVWTDESNKQHFILRDLSGVSDGQHTVRARYYNVWGEGEPSDPFVFNKSRPGKQAIRLIP